MLRGGAGQSERVHARRKSDDFRYAAYAVIGRDTGFIPMQATAFLKNPAGSNIGPMVAIFGAEHWFKREALAAVVDLVLGKDRDAEEGPTKFRGKDVDFATVQDALLTVSMWSPRQVIVVEEADDFVSDHRAALEKYLDRPAKKSVLVLEVKTWPSTTKLAKRVAEVGLPVDCAPPKGAELPAWVVERANTGHGKKLTRSAAATLIQLAGSELGLLDQELAKLAAFAGDKATIDEEAIHKLVGGWRAETTWKMVDAFRDGQTAAGLELLDGLMRAGEPAMKLLAGVQYTQRGIAKGTELSRQGRPLETALSEGGVKPFAVQATIAYLKRIGRPRAERILLWMLGADLDIKGRSQLPERIVLERLMLQLAGATPPGDGGGA
jgi:DNA polymerase III subunit delta